MRVYEYAKQHNLLSKELISILRGGGFDVANHMSVLAQGALDFLDQNLGKAGGVFREQESRKIKSESDMAKIPKEEGAEEPALKKEKNVSKELRVEEEKQIKEKDKRRIPLRPMALGNFAIESGHSASSIILTLLKWGIVCTKNQILTEGLISRLSAHYEIDTFVSPVKMHEKKIEKLKTLDSSEQERSPVVVVMGHVDHGKTTLLDFIRKTRVASREKGGITQHLGAYEVETSRGNVVFLDTPGHEAFAKIRMRGARAADIAVLVVAADDGLMPQSVEAIQYAKSAEIPIIVAINKIDKVPSSKIESVKQGLIKYDLLPEEWGGDVICVPISAKLGEGIDGLLDIIILQAQIMDLKANLNTPARGYVLESKIEKGRGPVATTIFQHGCAKVGDFFICGDTFGKISSFIDSHGKKIFVAKPSSPFLVAGFNALPNAGDFFEVVSRQDYSKAVRGKLDRKSLTHLRTIGGYAKESFNLIVKTDSDSSKGALIWSIEKLSNKLESGFNLINASVGDICESDVELAAVSEAILVGLHVKAESKALQMAQRLNVDVRLFNIIYKLIEELEAFSESKKEVKKEFKKVGEAIVIRLFDIKNVGVIAGCQVKEGYFSRRGKVVIWRKNMKLGDGKISSLQREKKSVKEVHAGFECAFLVEGFNEWAIDDRVECFLELPRE